MTLFERIREFLGERDVPFSMVSHQPTTTSAESAAARGEDLATGGKAIVIKVDDSFRIFVLSAARRLDSKKLKRMFKAKGVRFADRAELLELTGLEPGAVPPFGRPFFTLDLYIDESVSNNPRIAFNAGSLTDSIVMQTADYLDVAAGTIADFSRP